MKRDFDPSHREHKNRGMDRQRERPQREENLVYRGADPWATGDPIPSSPFDPDNREKTHGQGRDSHCRSEEASASTWPKRGASGRNTSTSLRGAPRAQPTGFCYGAIRPYQIMVRNKTTMPPIRRYLSTVQAISPCRAMRNFRSHQSRGGGNM